ncbi:hypothetical protein ABTI12_20290, partial [Acinetobacter baumannii]
RGVRTERRETPTTVSLQPVKGAKVVERSTVVRPSHLIVSATISKGDDKLVRNLKTEVAADKKSVKVTGEWIGPDPSTNPTAAHITMTLV